MENIISCGKSGLVLRSSCPRRSTVSEQSEHAWHRHPNMAAPRINREWNYFLYIGFSSSGLFTLHWVVLSVLVVIFFPPYNSRPAESTSAVTSEWNAGLWVQEIRLEGDHDGKFQHAEPWFEVRPGPLGLTMQKKKKSNLFQEMYYRLQHNQAKPFLHYHSRLSRNVVTLAEWQKDPW